LIQNSLESVQDIITNRKNSFEIYGYDVMVDNDLNPWLIEINSSPSMDYSTVIYSLTIQHITEHLVKEMLEDATKVVIDLPQSKDKANADTGSFELIYKGDTLVEKPIGALGMNFNVEGTKIKKFIY
jgi:tubulin monoglycylase TTLL3/8